MKRRERTTETEKREMVRIKGAKMGDKKPERDGLDAPTSKLRVFVFPCTVVAR